MEEKLKQNSALKKTDAVYKRGLSLVETVVTIAMATFAIIAIGSFTITFYRDHAYAIEQAFAVNSARKGVDRMVRDIREASFSDEGDFPIVSIGPYDIVFFSDIDHDDMIERVRFTLNSGTLFRGQAESAGMPSEYPVDDDSETIVSDYVRNEAYGHTLFRYYDKEGIEITDYGQIMDVTFVTVDMIVNINPDRLPRDFSLRSSASLRNTHMGTE
jgi:Tfp pilus assembly protein PilW